ncbi:MAG TPA: hypothetical protein VK578_19620 [Edaphobacter sp.]|nr:hypothetical protein [Edaphobacter sp.]
MSESKQKQSKQQRFLAAHPNCYFCGGIRQAITVDHVPPRACFPIGHVPDGFESPACKKCNKGSVKDDLIFGFYSMLLDFDESPTKRQENDARLKQLKEGIINNYPDALPDQATASPVYRVGSIYTTSPVRYRDGH